MKKHFLLLFTAYIAASASYAQAPTITSFNPSSGPVGTLVHITGTHLSSPTAFTIGGVSAILVSDADTTLVGMVMPGAATGIVSVTTAVGTATGGSSFTVTHTPYPSTQQGPKLVGIGAEGLVSLQGVSVSISADGNTAIVGGSEDRNDTGAAWIYSRSGGAWIQQGPKLVGSGMVNAGGGVFQGSSVAISADGNTVIVGGYGDSNYYGAAWVYTRTDSIWTQQGPKLMGASAEFGTAVAISADGNTAIIGGPADDSIAGAVWIFIRSGGVWAHQGPKLVGTGAVNAPHAGAAQGASVSLSADGNTAIVGGWRDNSDTGAAWVFTRTDTIWTQQGPKLLASGTTGASGQGMSVSISADGNTAIVGGGYDNGSMGAAWIYSRSAGLWREQGAKLVGTGASSIAGQGRSVSLSADGNVALIGGNLDNGGTGAVWMFVRSDTNWSQMGSKLIGTGYATISNVQQGISASLSADGTTAIVGGYDDNANKGAAWVFRSCSQDSSTISYAICQGDTFTIGSKHYTASNTYIDTLTNVGGCDSIVTLHLTVNPLPVVTLSWQTLIQQHDLLGGFIAVGGDTLWGRYCNPDIFPMAGGLPSGGFYSGKFIANDTFKIAQYRVHEIDTIYYTFTDSLGCRASVSDTFRLELCEGIQEVSGIDLVHLYPNPNTGTFTLQKSQMHDATYTISNMLGQIIQQDAITSDSQLIDIGAAPVGIYMLSISGLSGSVKFAVMR